jgi:hypothetical protein
MTPRSVPAPAFQLVLEHAVFVNRSLKTDNTTLFADSLTAWSVFLNGGWKPTAMEGLVMDRLPAQAAALGHLCALQPHQDKWA